MRIPIASLLLVFALRSPLFSGTEVPTLQTALTDLTVAQNTPIADVDLTSTFSVPGVPSAIVQFRMAYGTANTPGIFNVKMLPASAPNTVTNFLSYVTAGSYNSTIVHRSEVTGPGSNVSIFQGGSFQSPAFGTVPTNAPINLEYSLPNTRGTIAMARNTLPNTATSGWFFNVSDNTAIFAPGGSSTDGYAAFGEVMGTGLTAVDAINALPTFVATSLNAAFTNLPLSGYTNPPGLLLANFVRVNSAAVVSLFPTTLTVNVTSCSTTTTTVGVATPVPANFHVGSRFLGTTVTGIIGTQVFLQNPADRDINVPLANAVPVSASVAGEVSVVTLTLTNTNPSLVAATISGSVLNLSLRTNRGGFADIAVNATDTNGNTAQSKFRLTVTGSAIATSVPKDANNDGLSDFIFQNSAGQLYEWLLDGTGYTVNLSNGAGLKAGQTPKFFYPGGLGDWRLVARTDVNNDGIPDLIFQNSVGQIYVWFLDGTGNAINFSTGAGLKTGLGTKYLYAGGLGDWRVVACTDVNGDGFPDLVFQNNAGQLYVWFLDGSANTINFSTGAGLKTGLAPKFLYPGGLGDWRVAACTDMNGDGFPDLVFQNNAGQLYVWFLDGSASTINFSTSAGLRAGMAPTFLYGAGLGDWRVFACTDLNGDGIPDLIFQNNAGQIIAWFLDGTGTTLNFSTGAGFRPGVAAAYLYTGGLGDWRIR